MILKVQVDDYASVIGEPGWLYYDHIAKARTCGDYVRVSMLHREPVNPVQAAEDERRISVNRDELRAWVEQAWGVERQFADELWPEFPDERAQRSVTCIHLTRDDGSMILALVAAPTFLMSDDGKTIDRLH